MRDKIKIPRIVSRCLPYILGSSVIFLLVLITTGCAGGPLVEVSVIDERTALENQILGSYKELDEEVVLLASVRSIDQSGKLVKVKKVPPGKKKVIRSIQRSSFNRDDIEKFKFSGILGENNNGGLTILVLEKIPSNQKEFLKTLVKEENEDRFNIMQRMIDVNENLTKKDLPEIRKVFASLNKDRAKDGEMIQLDNGEWKQKGKK